MTAADVLLAFSRGVLSLADSDRELLDRFARAAERMPPEALADLAQWIIALGLVAVDPLAPTPRPS